MAFAVAVLALGAVFAFLRSRSNDEAALLAVPIYRVLKQHEPDTYAKILESYRYLKSDDDSLERFTARNMSELSAAGTRRIAHASQEAVMNLMNDALTNLRILRTSGDDACFRYLFPQVGGMPDTGKYLSAQAQRHTLDLLAEVIRSSAESPQPLPSSASVERRLAPIVNEVYAEFGADAQMLANPSAPDVDRAKVCAISIALYERIMRLPPADASDVIRSMTQL